MMDLEILRHSCSHVMAQAVKELWPQVKLAIGPAIEDGFYYDFDTQLPFNDEDLKKIEDKMRDIIKDDLPFIRQEISKEEAKKLFKNLNEDYKLALLEEIPEEIVSIYKTGDRFVDLCRGPHLKSTGEIKAFKLLSVTGAYWRGIETNPMLQRIYGTCFDTADKLKEYLTNLEEAKKRDHRRLGPQLELFDIYHQQAGAGLVFYLPKGAILRQIIEDYLKEQHRKRGYELVTTPHLMEAELWRISGHYDYYKENMYIFKIEEKEFVLKPMNCPGHILIYKSRIRSYKELPLRLFELGTVYRREKTGVLHGLLRVRGFTQDDAHIFCVNTQLKTEIKNIIDFVFDTLQIFGFKEYKVELSTQPQKYIGAQQDWQIATSILEESLQEKDIKYEVNIGEGAFYGPKIDIKLKDALKRNWQCATIQCDFALPKRFNLTYIDIDGREKQPIMLHRVILGSLERFIGALVEHYAADFPVWLAPIQIAILPISDNFIGYAQKVKNVLEENKLRTILMLHSQTLSKRIRQTELERIPYCLILGKTEEAQNTVCVRRRKEDAQKNIPLEDFIKEIQEEIGKFH